MLKYLLSLKTLLILISVLSIPLTAAAQANRTWVSGIGDDVNPCSRTSPCKTFAGAITQTNVGGEIDVLDAAGFGAVTITKSITIDGTGGFGATLAAGTTGININITAASDARKTVRLRNLSINGLVTGLDGIRVVAATQLFVDDVLIDGFSQNGINVSATGTYVSVRNSVIRNIAHSGINLQPGGASPRGVVSIEGCSVSTTENGISATEGVKATIRDSAILHNQIGVLGQRADITLINSLIAHGGRGVMSRSGNTIRLSSMTITLNDTGLVLDGGKIVSYKNNVVDANVTDGAPSSSVSPI